MKNKNQRIQSKVILEIENSENTYKKVSKSL